MTFVVSAAQASQPQPTPSGHISCGPIEQCTSPEPNMEAPVFVKKPEPEKMEIKKSLSIDKDCKQWVNNMSDLGVDTEALPKPMMTKTKADIDSPRNKSPDLISLDVSKA